MAASREALISRVRERAKVELAKRRLARYNLVAYSRSITIPGAPMGDDPETWVFKPVETGLAAHHVLTMEAIQRCIEKDYGRLMIFEPPGSAKSTYASVVAPSWAMGKYAGIQVLMTSYGSRPIERHSKRARQIVASDQYRAIWDTELTPGSRAADQWNLTNGSQLYAAGLMGAITSTRCDLGIIDDPVAGRAEAASETIRASTLQAYEDDFLTRLKPGASVILIQTRWDEEDLAGSILPEDWDGQSGEILCRDGKVWEVLCLPAECERQDDPLGREIGEYLWPEWFDDEHWAIYKRNQRTWEALYQQRPRPLGGSFFSESSLLDEEGKPVECPLHMDAVYAIVDTAAKTGKDHDGIAVTFFARTQHLAPPLLILDWDLKQMEGAMLKAWIPTIFERLEQFAKDLKVRYGSLGVFIEDKSSGIILLQQVANDTAFAERGWQAHAIESGLTALGKVERALNVSGYVHAGLVKITPQAFNRTVTYKDSTRNHLMSQVLGFDPGIKDMGADDLLDTFTYGLSIGLGNYEGF